MPRARNTVSEERRRAALGAEALAMLVVAVFALGLDARDVARARSFGRRERGVFPVVKPGRRFLGQLLERFRQARGVVGVEVRLEGRLHPALQRAVRQVLVATDADAA